MRHPNVLPLLGTCQWYMMTAFVVPWTDGGTCNDYLYEHPGANRLQIARQVAAGLAYMHTRRPAVVHGDVRAHTVLLSADGTAQISNFDFGPSQDPVQSFDKSFSFIDGPLRNSAPDYIRSETAHRTIWSDVYSFGMFLYEMYAGHPPYPDVIDYVQLLETVRSGQTPDRPTHAQLNDDIWALTLLCWRRRPMSRPTMTQVYRRLVELATNDSMLDKYQSEGPRETA